MHDFLSDLQRFAFLRYAVAAGLLAAVAAGVVGSLVTARRLGSVAGSIAHATLGGLGAAAFLHQVHGLRWATPTAGALAGALVAALAVGLVTLYGKEREETVLAAVWSVGMAVGLLFLQATPGYNQDLMSYLFGDILLLTAEDLWRTAALDVAVLGLCILFYPVFLAVSFDEEFARVRGARVALYHLLLLGLTAVTVVLLVQMVGIVLVIALLTLPAATAALFTRRLWQMMLLAVALAAASSVGGIALSYGPDLPAGPTIILLAGALYLAALLATAGLRRVRRA